MGEKTIFKNGQNYEQAVSKEEIKEDQYIYRRRFNLNSNSGNAN